MKVLENTPAVLSLGKLCDENGYSEEWINGQKPHLFFQWFSDTVQHWELRSYCGSWLVSEFFLQFSLFNMTPSKQEIDHPTSSSSSSTSPTTTVLSDSETRESEDQSGIDSPPVLVSSSNVEEMIERWDPLFAAESGKRSQANQKNLKPVWPVIFWNPGVAARIQRKSFGWKSSWTTRLTRQFFSWSIFRAHIQEKWGFR